MNVVFGTGPLGLAVMRELVNQGKPVRLVNRTGQRPADIPDHVEVRGGDAFDPGFTQQSASSARVVFQCANPPYSKWLTHFIALQDTIMEAAIKAGAKFIVGDNMYMYGVVDGPIHEELPYKADTRKGKVRAEAARKVMEAHHQGRVQASIGRGSDFFGPRVLSSQAGDRMFLPAVQGNPAVSLGNLDVPHTYTYIGDFGKALVLLSEREEALGQVWHVPNAETVTSRRFMEMIFEELGRPAKIKSMGRAMLALGGIFIPEARESLEMMYQFDRPFIVDSSKFTRAFGVSATPLRESIHEAVAWYRRYHVESTH